MHKHFSTQSFLLILCKPFLDCDATFNSLQSEGFPFIIIAFGCLMTVRVMAMLLGFLSSELEE